MNGDRHAEPREKLIVALDLPAWSAVEPLVQHLGTRVSWYKVGLQLFTAEGPGVVRKLVSMGKRVFLDLKLHDIPNTVERTVEAASALGASLLTVHAAVGREALERAAQIAKERGGPDLLGVTVLTSRGGMEPAELEAAVVEAAGVCERSGLGGIVAPAVALTALRRRFGDRLRILCPGIRPRGAGVQDQKWVATPREAVGLGARWIVVGRPILEAEHPGDAAQGVLEEIEEAAGEIRGTGERSL